MGSLFQVGVVGKADKKCGGLKPVVQLVKKGLVPIVQIGIPIILIVLGTIDLGKAVIASDEKAVKAAQSMLIKRAIYAVAIFFITTIVTLLMSVVASGADKSEANTSGWAQCWNSIK